MNSKIEGYQKQPSGYLAFVPKSLSPRSKLSIDPKMNRQLIKAEKELMKLNAASFFLSNPELFIELFIKKEALLSSQIEGIQATMTDILTYEAWDEVDNFDDVEEVVNYIKAWKDSLKKLEKLPLCNRIIKSAHAILLHGERGKNKVPGEFRKSQNWIGASLKNAIFVPPPQNLVYPLMGDLEKFIHQKDSLHPLVKCAFIHYQFETIHPFLDGNGRIGRLLIDLYLFWENILEKPLLYISLFFKLHRQEYFDRLMLVRNNGDFEQWVLFFLKAIIWSSTHAVDKIKQILFLQQNLKQKIIESKKATTLSIQFLDQLFKSPLVTISDVGEKLHLSYQGAKDQVSLFLKLGILVEMTGQKRGKRYAFKPYLEIIER